MISVAKVGFLKTYSDADATLNECWNADQCYWLYLLILMYLHGK